MRDVVDAGRGHAISRAREGHFARAPVILCSRMLDRLLSTIESQPMRSCMPDWSTRVPKYRIYLLNPDGGFAAVREAECQSDEAAVAKAATEIGGHAGAEVWERGRKVGFVPRVHPDTQGYLGSPSL
jgi:hypothetical protein